MRFFEQVGDRRQEEAFLGNLGVAYSFLGEGERAVALLEKALEIGRELQDERIIQVATNYLKQLRP